MRIGLDIDGVLADFNKSFVTRVVEDTGRSLFPTWPFDIPCWAYPAYYGYTTDEERAVWQSVMNDETFWQRLDAYDGVFEQLQRLDDLDRFSHDVYFITSRPGVGTKWQTERWLKAHGVTAPTVLISGKKGDCARALQLDYYIDDRDVNCVDVKQSSALTEVFLLNQPWNQELAALKQGIRRIGAVSEFMDAVKAAELRPA